MKLKIVKAKEKDLRKIAEIYKEEFSKPPYNESWTVQKAMGKIRLFCKASTFYDTYKIEYGNEIIGFIVINKNIWSPGFIFFIEEFALKSGFQGRGFGGDTLNYIEKQYKKRGFRTAMLLSLKKSKSNSIYRKLGYQKSRGQTLFEKSL